MDWRALILAITGVFAAIVLIVLSCLPGYRWVGPLVFAVTISLVLLGSLGYGLYHLFKRDKY